MKLFKTIFGSKEAPIHSYSDFWNWFVRHEKKFYNVIQSGRNIESDFFDVLAPRLNELREGYFYLTGMADENTAELIITADGAVKNFVFVEELIAQAPALPGWKFTAHKPALEIENVNISMGGYEFGANNLAFIPNTIEKYPDEIELTVTHPEFRESNSKEITNGVFIFLDNYLGELNAVTLVDNLSVKGKADKVEEPVPMIKLKDYLAWREKEFIEKYQETRYTSDNDQHAILEAELENGGKLIATVNTDLLQWDGKASHPWILTVAVNFAGKRETGMPDDDTYQQLNGLEDELVNVLPETGGNLHVGRQTTLNAREIYFACRDFRAASKAADAIAKKFGDVFEVSYEIYKDKYWRSFSRFDTR